MAQHLDNTDKFFWARKNRFPEQFLGDVRALCNTTVTDVVNKEKVHNLVLGLFIELLVITTD